jgi:hypothetical protein
VGATTSVLPELTDGSAPTHGRNRRRWVIAAAATAVAVVGAGGIALALSLQATGTNPEEVVPASAVGYMKVDLDPSAAQKVDALRFLHQLPSTDSRLGSGDDLRSVVVQGLLQDQGTIDYSRDVQPWIGDRYAIAAVPAPGGGTPLFEIALQVTDSGAATTALNRLAPTMNFGFVISNGYAVISDNQTDAQSLAAAAAKSPLSTNPEYTSAVAPLGDGVATVWADAKGMTEMLQQLPGASSVSGLSFLQSFQTAGKPLVAVLRFQSNALELVGTVPTDQGVQPSVSGAATIGDLPASTAAAVELRGEGEILSTRLDQLFALAGTGAPTHRELKQVERQTGLRLPQDLQTLFGNDFVASLDGGGLVGIPKVGVVSHTDPVAARDLAARLQPLLDNVTAGLGVVVRPTNDGMVIATSSDYADVLTAQPSTGDTLAGSTAFTDAVPDFHNADTVVYVDINALTTALAAIDPSATDQLKGLQSFGWTTTAAGGTSTVRMRLTTTG